MAISLPSQAVASSEDCASRSLPAKGLRNIPRSESDESSSEVVQVHDPRHPLHGQLFRVLRRVVSRDGTSSASYEVEYGTGRSLLIPVRVTQPYDAETNHVKLSIEALQELISTVECLEGHEHGSTRPLGDVATGSAASNCRRGRGGSGGDLP